MISFGKKFLLGVGSVFLLGQGQADAQVANRTVVKFNLSGVIIQSYTAQVERVLNRYSSITLSGNYVANGTPLPFKQALLDQYQDNADARRAIETTLFSKKIATLEYRFYPAGHAPTGWYIAPFVRYANMNISNDYQYRSQDGGLHQMHLEANFSAGGAGILLGYQFLLGKHIGLDLWLLGPFYGTNVNAVFSGTDPYWKTLTPYDITKMKSDIDNTQLPLYTVSSTFNLPLVTANLDGPYYGVRAFGVAFAYSF
ncbi:hypothetical protein GCM10028805_09130 [Spirosoma harenae]